MGKVSSFSFILQHIIQFFPVAFQIVCVFVSGTAYHPSRADGHFVFTVPFGGCIGVLSLLLLAFQERGKADAGLGGRHRNACQFTESGQQVDSGLVSKSSDRFLTG